MVYVSIFLILYDFHASTIVSGPARTHSAPSNRPRSGAAHQEDPRQACDTTLARFYEFEAPKTAGSKQSTSQQSGGMLDSLVNKGSEGSMGKRKKDTCFKLSQMERLVGLDGLAERGQRVVISSRGQEVRKTGWPSAGTIVDVLGREYCVVKWDDGSGPYKYSTNSHGGFQVAFLPAEQEDLFVFRKRANVYWCFDRSDSSSGSAVGTVGDALAERGFDVSQDLKASGGGHMGVDLPHAQLVVICVTPAYLNSFKRNGACKQELEFALQVQPAHRLLVLKFDQRIDASSFGMLSAPLSKVQTIDVSRGATASQIDQLVERFTAAAESRPQTSAESRPQSSSSARTSQSRG